MKFMNLTDEQKEKIAGCKDKEDYLSLARELGYELSEEELDNISGGDDVDGWADRPCCPNCGSYNVAVAYDGGLCYRCRDCGCEW